MTFTLSTSTDLRTKRREYLLKENLKTLKVISPERSKAISKRSVQLVSKTYSNEGFTLA